MSTLLGHRTDAAVCGTTGTLTPTPNHAHTHARTTNRRPFGDRVDKSLWSPAIDNVELFGSPADLLADGKVAKVPMLFGTNRDEGSTFTYNQSGTGDSNGHAGADVTSMYDGFLFNLGQLWSNSWRGPPNISAQSFSTGLFVNESEFTTWASAAPFVLRPSTTAPCPMPHAPPFSLSLSLSLSSSSSSSSPCPLAAPARCAGCLCLQKNGVASDASLCAR